MVSAGHYNGIHLACKRPDLILSLVGGVTDGVENKDAWESLLQGLHHLLEFFFILSRLCHYKCSLHLGQCQDVFDILDQVNRALAVAYKTYHLGMVLIAYNYRGVPLP